MNFFFLAAGMFALGCDDYIFAGLLPGISTSFQSSIIAAAQGISVYGITYVGALPLCVFLLTKKSTRQVLLLALLTFIAGNLLTLMSLNLSVYIAGRAIAGLGAGLYLPLAIATAGELVEPAAKGRALSLAWGSNAAGAVIGIPIGLWLADKIHWRASIIMILILSLIALLGLISRAMNLKVTTLPSLREQASLLVDPGVMSVIAVTLLTATGGLGLYVYISTVLEGTAIPPATALSLWNIGGLIGSLSIGFIADRFGKPQWVMLSILGVQVITFLSIPTLSLFPLLGNLPFFLWGALGWSTMTPQQLRLSQLKPGHDATMVALNSTAVSLGSVFGTTLGGLALAGGLNMSHLPYAATGLIFSAFTLQILLILQAVLHKN